MLLGSMDLHTLIALECGVPETLKSKEEVAHCFPSLALDSCLRVVEWAMTQERVEGWDNCQGRCPFWLGWC